MTSLRSRSPSSKRIKLGVEISSKNKDLEGLEIPQPQSEGPDQDDSENSCSICLHSIADRTVIPKCSHEFCFECLLVWTEQSRRCPLCSQAIGEYLIHSIRSRYDYRKHYLCPLRTSPVPSRPAQTNAVLQTTLQRRRREREWGIRRRESDEADKLERSIAKRRWMYRHDLYAKHVASNPYTKYRPYPTPAQFAASQDLISRTITFLRRELQIWEGLDVEFLTTLIISLMKAIDIRSESAVKLISEFLDMDAPYTPGGRHVNAEHFAHEVYSYVRSPYKDLFVYDTVVQYDTPSHLRQPTDIERSHRWREPSPAPLLNEDSAHSQKRSRSRSSEKSTSWSPSGRKYSPTSSSRHHRRTSRSPRPNGDIPKWDKHRQNSDSGHLGRQNNLGDALNEREKETLIRDVIKGKRKADGLTSLVQPPEVTEMKPIKNFRVPRNRSLLESVRAHLAVPGESAQQSRTDCYPTNPQPQPQPSSTISLQKPDPVASLLTRLSDLPGTMNSKSRNMSGNCQGDHDKHETWQKASLTLPRHNLSHHDVDNSSNTRSFGRQLRPPSLSRSQDSTSGPNCSMKTPASSKNSSVSVPILCQNIEATVEDNVPSDQGISSRSLPVPSNSPKKDNPPNQFQNQIIPHVQSPLSSSIDAVYLNLPNQSHPLAQSTSLNSAERRTRLLARLEIEKQQMVRRSAMDSKISPQPLDGSLAYSSSFTVSRKNPHFEREPDDVPDLASESLVSEDSRRKESKLRARAQLRVRLAAEKRVAS